MTSDIFPPDVRAKLAAAGPAVPHPGPFALPRPGATDEAIATFTEACEAVGGRVSRVTSTDAAVAIVAGYLEAPEWRAAGQAGTAPFVTWDAETLPLPGVPEQLRARGAEALDTHVHAEEPQRSADMQRLDRAVVGVTGADAAFADTGSVALVHGPGRARLVSLLPPVHVALVPVAYLHASFGSWVAAQPGVLRSSANVVVVTGPSRTADIEMTLTRGVHGPRFVHVVFVG